MTPNYFALIAAAAACAITPAWAEDPPDHGAHHAQAGASAASAPRGGASAAPGMANGMGMMDESKMRAMHEMHARMMGGEGSVAELAARQRMLEKRLDMVESMLKLLAERRPPPPPAPPAARK